MLTLPVLYIQILILIFSNHIRAQSFEGINNDRYQQAIQFCGCFYGKGPSEQTFFDKNNNDQAEHLGEIFYKLIKRRPQPKANLAGLWGVPTRFV